MSTPQEIYEIIGPAGISCKDLLQTSVVPQAELETHLNVLLSTKRIVVLNGTYVQVMKYDDYYDDKGLLKPTYSEHGIADFTKEELVQIPSVPLPPPDRGPEDRRCGTCHEVKSRSCFTSRLNKKTNRLAWSQDCNRCASIRTMKLTEFGRWLLTQPESEWARMRRQRRQDTRKKQDTLGCGISPNGAKEPESAHYEERKICSTWDHPGDNSFLGSLDRPIQKLSCLHSSPYEEGCPTCNGEPPINIPILPETAQEAPGAAIEPDPPPVYGGALAQDLETCRKLLKEVLHAPDGAGMAYLSKNARYLPEELLGRIWSAIYIENK